MSPEEAFELLVQDENLVKMNAISRLPDPMEQGYETAPLIAGAAAMRAREVAFKMIRTSHMANPNRPDSDIWRDLGLLKWCFENWEE